VSWGLFGCVAELRYRCSVFVIWPRSSQRARLARRRSIWSRTQACARGLARCLNAAAQARACALDVPGTRAETV